MVMKKIRRKNKNLEYTYENYNNIKHDFFIWSMGALIPVLMQMELNLFILFILAWTMPMLIVVAIDYLLGKRNVKKNNIIQNKGIKVKGIIEDVYIMDMAYGHKLIVKVQDDEYRIKKINKNRALKLLREYLYAKNNRQLYKDEMRNTIFDMDVEIDLYIHKGKVYADLRSIDLDAIEERYNFYIDNQKRKIQ